MNSIIVLCMVVLEMQLELLSLGGAYMYPQCLTNQMQVMELYLNTYIYRYTIRFVRLLIECSIVELEH